MPDLVKIGMTTGTATSRAKSLSRVTAIPEPFFVSYYQEAFDVQKVETRIFRALRLYRSNSSREFFRLSTEQAEAIIRTLMLEARLSKPEYVVPMTDAGRAVVIGRYSRLVDEYITTCIGTADEKV